MSSPAVLPRGARRALGRLDHAVYRAVRGRLHHAEVTPRVAAFSRLGEHAGLWLGIGATGAVLDLPRRDRWVRGLQLVAGAYVANTAVKNVIGRQRPAFEEFPALIRTPTQLSFPSAHATSSFCAAAAYRGLLPAGALYAHGRRDGRLPRRARRPLSQRHRGRRRAGHPRRNPRRQSP